MIPQPLRDGDDVCQLADRWGIAIRLADKLLVLAREAPDLGLMIISGLRSCEEQMALAAAGRPAADCDRSTHVACPATGADLWTTASPIDVSGRLNRPIVARFGAAVRFVGLRWGGGSEINAWGAPTDWNHVDLGPR